jgi:hypothetical protein
MLVTLTIMMVVTSVLLFKQSSFDSSTVLRSLAYSVALSVRQAQVYGTSVVGTTTASCTGGYSSNGTCYASAYGLNFTWGSSNPTSYTLFADLSPGTYTPSVIASEVTKTFTLNNGYQITNFCVSGVNAGSAVKRCAPAAISSIDILFKRPNPDAQLMAFDSGGAPIAGDAYSSACIQIQSINDANNTKSITVSTTGEVTVNTATGSGC